MVVADRVQTTVVKGLILAYFFGSFAAKNGRIRHVPGRNLGVKESAVLIGRKLINHEL